MEKLSREMLDLQELTDALTKPDRKISASQEIQLQTILTSKLDSLIQANVINHANQKDAWMIWEAIFNYFASYKALNRARVFKELL
jgi:hypothetical protein